MLFPKFALSCALALLPMSAAAETIATCSAVAGRAFFVEKGIVPKDLAGWGDDTISSGRFTLSRDAEGKFDLNYADASGGVFSSRSEGATVVASRLAPDDIAVLVAYPGSTVEIYHFVRDKSGVQRLMLLQSKGGGPITKASVLVGQCSLMKLPTD